MPLTHTDFEELVMSVWNVFDERGLRAADAAIEHSNADPTVSALVQLTGASHGVVRIDCHSRAAWDLAVSMFGTSADELGAEDVHDAVGEFVNILGGNIKGLFPPDSTLSLPVIVDSPEDEFGMSSEGLTHRLELWSGEHPVRFTFFALVR
jgi:chemotaxis protein CheX